MKKAVIVGHHQVVVGPTMSVKMVGMVEVTAEFLGEGIGVGSTDFQLYRVEVAGVLVFRLAPADGLKLGLEGMAGDQGTRGSASVVNHFLRAVADADLSPPFPVSEPALASTPGVSTKVVSPPAPGSGASRQ